jgi:hypothetical protein
MKPKFILIILALILVKSGKAQQPVTVSFFNEATSIPYTRFISTPVHPGIQAGTEFGWREGKHVALYPTINLGYMFHRNLFQGIYVNVELAFDVKTGIGLNFKSRLGLGYLHTFTTRQEFQFSDGQYVSKPDKGNPRLMPSLTLGLGYNLRRGNDESPEIFVLYKSWIEYPYSPGFIPLMSHADLHLGVKIYPFKKQGQ